MPIIFWPVVGVSVILYLKIPRNGAVCQLAAAPFFVVVVDLHFAKFLPVTAAVLMMQTRWKLDLDI